MSRQSIPDQFTVGASALRTFGPNGNGRKEVTIARITKTLVTDSDGNRYYAMLGSAESGRLYAYGSQSMWPGQLQLNTTKEG